MSQAVSRLLRLAAALLPILAILIFRDPAPPKLAQTERVLLVTAHPDDECFFFGPTLLALSPQTTSLYSLTLSNGNNDGLGLTREPELRSSLSILGIPPERSFLFNHPELQDNFTRTWDSELVAQTVLSYVLENEITILLTFDHMGVSSHPNHYSLYFGAVRLLGLLPPEVGSLHAYALKTYPLLLKYSSWTSLIANLYVSPFRSGGSPAAGLPALRFTSGLGSYLTTLKAMNQHRSQLVWFRWLYLLFSSYMWQNDWIEIERGEGAGW